MLCTGLILSSGCSVSTNQLRRPPDPNQVLRLSGSAELTVEASAECPPLTDSFLSSFATDLINWPDRIIDDSRDTILASDNLTTLLLAGGASITLHQSNADKRLARHFTKHRVLNSFVDESFNIIGNPGTHFAATGLWYALAANKGDEFNKQRAWTMTTALAITGLTTVGLKLIRDNDTPNEKRFAWPSGHTASSFTVASVLDEFYGPEVGLPAYALAGFVGFRMMDSGDHWASDVVFGTVLGWVVGHTVAGKHKKLELAGFQVMPCFAAGGDSSTMGLALMKRF